MKNQWLGFSDYASQQQAGESWGQTPSMLSFATLFQPGNGCE
ncbi:hypothetical protein [Ewingella americana]